MYVVDIVRGLGHELRLVATSSKPPHRHLRDILAGLLIATIGVELVCAVLGYLFERHAPHSEVRTFGEAVFWTSTQLLTVSSNLPNPVTTAGRVLDVVMEVYAISVSSTLAGTMGAFIIRRARDLERTTDPAP